MSDEEQPETPDESAVDPSAESEDGGGEGTEVIANVPAIIEVLAEDPSPGPNQRRRRVVRREHRPLDQDERREIDDQIVDSNQNMRRLEVEKAAANKKYNGEIADHRQTMDDAIDVLAKDSIESDMTRVEVLNYDDGMVRYYDLDDVNFDECIDEREMTEDEKQTKMEM